MNKLKKSVICHVDRVYATSISSCSSFSQLHEIKFGVLRNKPRMCPDIRKKTLLPFAI